MGIILFIVAIILSFTVFVTALIYGTIKMTHSENQWYKNMAIAIDQFGNVLGSPYTNQYWIKPEGHQFGNPQETMSSVLGKNIKTATLLPEGGFIGDTLDKIQPNHCIISIDNNV